MERKKKVKAVPIGAVRRAIKKAKNGAGVVTIGQVAHELCLHNQGRVILCDRMKYLHQKGELEWVSKATYRHIMPKREPVRGIYDRLWTVLRAKPTVNVDTLQELGSVKNRKTVQNYIYLLIRFGYVKRVNSGRSGIYKLVKDPVERPKLHYTEVKSE
jgi:hypothetical protein